MWSEKNVAVLTEEGAFALFFRPHSGGIWQVKRPHRREFAIQAEKNANVRGSAGGEVVGLGTAGKTDAILVLNNSDGPCVCFGAGPWQSYMILWENGDCK